MKVGSKMDTQLQQQSDKGNETVKTGQLSNKSIELGVVSFPVFAKFGFANIFDILNFVISMDEMDSWKMLEEDLHVEPRKARAALVEIADLMKSLKLRKKGLIDKRKSKQAKA